MMPRCSSGGRTGAIVTPTAAALAAAALAAFRRTPDAVPCTRLALSASDFADGPASEEQGAITRFFAAAPPGL